MMRALLKPVRKTHSSNGAAAHMAGIGSSTSHHTSGGVAHPRPARRRRRQRESRDSSLASPSVSFVVPPSPMAPRDHTTERKTRRRSAASSQASPPSSPRWAKAPVALPSALMDCSEGVSKEEDGSKTAESSGTADEPVAPVDVRMVHESMKNTNVRRDEPVATKPHRSSRGARASIAEVDAARAAAGAITVQAINVGSRRASDLHIGEAKSSKSSDATPAVHESATDQPVASDERVRQSRSHAEAKDAPSHDSQLSQPTQPPRDDTPSPTPRGEQAPEGAATAGGDAAGDTKAGEDLEHVADVGGDVTSDDVGEASDEVGDNVATNTVGDHVGDSVVDNTVEPGSDEAAGGKDALSEPASDVAAEEKSPGNGDDVKQSGDAPQDLSTHSGDEVSPQLAAAGVKPQQGSPWNMLQHGGDADNSSSSSDDGGSYSDDDTFKSGEGDTHPRPASETRQTSDGDARAPGATSGVRAEGNDSGTQWPSSEAQVPTPSQTLATEGLSDDDESAYSDNDFEDVNTSHADEGGAGLQPFRLHMVLGDSPAIVEIIRSSGGGGDFAVMAYSTETGQPGNDVLLLSHTTRKVLGRDDVSTATAEEVGHALERGEWLSLDEASNVRGGSARTGVMPCADFALRLPQVLSLVSK